MIGLIVSVLLFNLIAFKTNQHLTKNQIVHIWTFTIVFQLLDDRYIDVKYGGYWYFTKAVDWESLPAITPLIPPVNMMFLNWYPFQALKIKKVLYFVYWTVGLILYERFTLLPQPFGYFHYGWWTIWYSVVVDPILLFLLLMYYKWICRIENSS
ncbi:hypothetical protein [Ectobacillus funiculus]|uniref:hypothetical protein n=1 Tax=Ectobacillus funiculus TaxID=137993 RepID=UPI00101B5C76|nr:hypothetical protein [Ectobacillus funiculus]